MTCNIEVMDLKAGIDRKSYISHYLSNAKFIIDDTLDKNDSEIVHGNIADAIKLLQLALDEAHEWEMENFRAEILREKT